MEVYRRPDSSSILSVARCACCTSILLCGDEDELLDAAEGSGEGCGEVVGGVAEGDDVVGEFGGGGRVGG